MMNLTSKLVANILQALKVFERTAHSSLGLFTTFLIFGDTCSFFNKNPQVLGLRLNQPRDHTLLNDGVASGT